MGDLASLLTSCVVCCTGLEEDLRTGVKRRVEELGGRYSPHLTRDCTHLVVNVGATAFVHSPKYKLALKLGIPAVQAGWIDETWRLAHNQQQPSGDQKRFVTQILVKKHLVNGLMGCRVSVTGISFEERAGIATAVSGLGGVYSPDLTPQCTHLIFQRSLQSDQELIVSAGSDIGGDSLLSSPSVLPVKVQYALKWNIPVVSLDWLAACRSTSALADEAEHLVSLAPIADIDTEPLPIALADITAATVPFLTGCHIALAEPLSPTRLLLFKKLILAAGAARYTDYPSHLTHLIVPRQQLSWLHCTGLPDGAVIVHDQWLVDSFKAGKRLPERDYVIERGRKDEDVSGSQLKKSQATPILPAKSSKWKSAFGRIVSSQDVLSDGGMRPSGTDMPAIVSQATPRRLLEGMSLVFAEDLSLTRRKKLTALAVQHGAAVAAASEAQLRIGPVFTDCRAESFTDLWLEASLEGGSLLPETKAFARPIVSSEPIASVYARNKERKFVVSQSGFTGHEREFYAQLIRQTGCTYTDTLSRANTHLLVESGAGASAKGSKYEFARKWGIRCVDLKGLKVLLLEADEKPRRSSPVASARSTAKASSDPFSQASLTFSLPDHSTDGAAGSNPQPRKQLSGKLVAASQRLWHRRDELASLVESMGGVFLWAFDRGGTHYLHQGSAAEDESFQELQMARAAGQCIVSPAWLVACKKQGRLASEQLYPHTFQEPSTPATEDSNQPAAGASGQDVALDWSAIVAQKRANDNRLRLHTKADFATIFSTAAQNQSEPLASTAKTATSTAFKAVVTGFSATEREAIKTRLLVFSPSIELATDEECSSPQVWSRQTVLICKQPALSEKFMCACAAGSWIVRKDAFLEAMERSDASKTRGVRGSWILKAAEGSEFTATSAPPGSETMLASAPRKWRRSTKRAFEGWRVCVRRIPGSREDDKAIDQYCSVLKAGGAAVTETWTLAPALTASQSQSQSGDSLPAPASAFTHFFYNDEHSGGVQHRDLLPASVPSYPLRWIVEYLFK